MVNRAAHSHPRKGPSMAVTFNTTWPATLTDAAWQKKKSFLDKAKSKTKTGLGAELTKAQAAWKLVKFDNLIATKVPMTTPTQLAKAKHPPQTHLTTVPPATSHTARTPHPKPAPPRS